jgi:PhnB protein
MVAKPIPDNYPPLTPYLCVQDAAAAIAFYKNVLGATERMRIGCPGGKIGHAELNIGTALIMLADEDPDMEFRSPQSIGGSPVTLHLYVEDVDEICRRALAAGATLTRPVQDQFYGDRSGQFRDPFGHVLAIATHKEDLCPQEIEKRAAALYG